MPCSSLQLTGILPTFELQKYFAMKPYLTFFILLISFLSGFCQVIPGDRHPDWKLIYENHRFIEPENILNVKDFGALGDGQTDDYQAVSNAIASLNGRLGIISFPTGNYLITQSLYLPDSVTLQGSSSDSTTLWFNFNAQALDAIIVSKGQQNNFKPVLSIGNSGSNWLTLSDVTGFAATDYIELRETNGAWDVVPIEWAANSVGHISQITEIHADTIFLKSPFRIGFDLSLYPEVQKIIPVSNVAINCMKIKRLDCPTAGAGSNILFNYATQCAVTGVESDVSVGSHISINNSSNIYVSGCYIHHACSYDGTGTRGYGVTMSQHSSECLVINNIFKHLRHAMMVKTGANGNIFAYNYSLEPYRSETIHDFSGDISLHGHYAFANLFEGNIVQNIIIDHYWGPAGPFNTFFRNRAELYGIYMTSSTLLETDQQNFVGNEVTKPNYPFGQYVLTGSDHFEFGNNIKGAIVPAGTDNLTDSSYFLNEKPHCWTDDLPWPSIGIPTVINTGSIPAQDRYFSGEYLTQCYPDSTLTGMALLPANNSTLALWPNPTTGIVHIQLNSQVNDRVYLTLFTPDGTTVWRADYRILQEETEIVLMLKGQVKGGLYVLKIASERFSTMKIILIVP